MKSARNPESGYALLFVYMMAAVVAIMLFNEVPRVAFEAQRDREQLLIDRGEQYERAVNLYVRKFNKYPADFDALNNTQNMRFLREKYVDPMTGKDDWRIIHVGPGGVFTDSLIYNKAKTSDADKDKSAPQNFITELPPIGGSQQDPSQQGVNLALRQRPSDQPGAPGDPNNPSQPQLDSYGQPIPPNAVPGQVLPDGAIVPFPTQNQNQNSQFPPGMTGLPNLPQTQQAGLQQPGFGQPGVTPGVAQPGFPYSQQPQQGFGQQPGQQPGQTQNGPPAAAANLIGQILTSPRPGGFNGLGAAPQQATTDQNGNPITSANPATAGTGTASTATTQAGSAAQTIGGGMAGVASKLKNKGIKVYKDQTTYEKWEFVYDITKDPMRGGGAAVPQAAGAQNGAQQNGALQSGLGGTSGSQTGGSTPAGTSTSTPTSAPATPSQ